MFAGLLQTFLGLIEFSFSSPDERVTNQGASNNGALFMVHSGTFTVQVTLYLDPENRLQPRDVRRMQPGTLFGDVAVALNCRRTATVKSDNFCQYGELSSASTKTIFKKHAFFADLMRRNVYLSYNDGLQTFLRIVLRRVEYLRQAPEDLLTHLAFCFRPAHIEKGQKIFGELDRATSIIIIAHGLVELSIEVEKSVVMVLDHLGRGSVLNSRSFLLESQTNCVARAVNSTVLYMLPLRVFNKIVSDDFPEVKEYILDPFVRKFLREIEGLNSNLDYLLP